MTKEKETLKKLGYIEPPIVKAGDERVLLGLFHKPPPLDVRVVAEDNYKTLLSAMEEQSIKFAEWCSVNRWYRQSNGNWHYVFEGGTSISKQEYDKHYIKTTSELYKLFNEL